MDVLGAGAALLGRPASGGLPSTSAQAILPLSAEQPHAAAPPVHGPAYSMFSGPHAPMLQAMAAVLLLACAAAILVHARLMRREQQRRRRAQETVLELRQRQTQREAMLKVSPLPGGSLVKADGPGRSAPETPEQVHNSPQQDRRGSRELPEVPCPASHQLPMCNVMHSSGRCLAYVHALRCFGG